MQTIHLIWILCQCTIIAEPRYIIFSSTSQTWFSANQKCKTEYNGDLADIDEIKEGSNNRKFTTCLNGSHELWTGEILYTTGYIAYKGCYSVPGSFHDDSDQMQKLTIAKCRLKCRYDQGFAIKENYCRCIPSCYALKSYVPVISADSFSSGPYCGLYGGNSSVSIYVKSHNQGHLAKLINPTADGLCVIGKCVKPMTGTLQVQYEKVRCEGQSRISAFCGNGAEQKNVTSWNDAVMFCVGQESYLTNIPVDLCMYGTYMWLTERKHQDVVRLKDTITEDATISCIAVNSSNAIGRQATGSNCHQLKKYVCVSHTDKAGKCSISLNASHHEISSTKGILTKFVMSSAASYISTRKNDVTLNNEAHGDITSSTSPDKHDTGNDGLTSGTGTLHTATTRDSSSITNGSFIFADRSVQSKTSSNNTPIIVGVSVGLTCVIAVGALLIFIYWKRNGFGFCQPNQKTPKDNHSLDKLSISGNHARANAFGKTVEIDQNSNFDNDCSSEAGPTIYALPMRKQRTPETETVCVDKETLDRAGSFHYDLAQPTGGHYDVNESYRESSTDDYYVTKAESDYDRLHQRRDKLRHQNVEDDYSHCLPGDDEYSYSRARDEGTRTNLDEDEYSHLASIKEEGFYDKCQR